MIEFRKMHGLGNDFVVLDSRRKSVNLSLEQIRLIADRHLGIGCDQIMIMHPAKTSGDIYLQMLNADGSEAGACGNGTRCVASILLSELNKPKVHIETFSGVLSAYKKNNMIAVDMGPACFSPEDIPFSNADLNLEDLLYVPFPEVLSQTATLVSMGNPHAVFFVSDCEAIELEVIGPLIESHAYFPHRANVEFVQRLSDQKFRMRVWERGAGITMACGSGACAAAVAGARLGLVKGEVEIELDGGSLWIEILSDYHDVLPKESSGKNRVIMTGPVSYSFSGQITDLLSEAGKGMTQ